MPDLGKLGVLFDGSFDGFLTIIYKHYYDKLNPDYIAEESGFQQTLDTCYEIVSTEPEKSSRVYDAIREKISSGCAQSVYNAYLSPEAQRFMHIYRYILLGFKVGAEVDRYMHYDYVLWVQKAARYAGHEAHLLSGFCRFTETKHGVLYASIGPVNNVLALLANHFTDRLMNEQWIIHDTVRNLAAVYDGNTFVITEVSGVNVQDSVNEAAYRDMWHTFYQTIAVENRKNDKLQRNNLPLRYRKYMTEFTHKK